MHCPFCRHADSRVVDSRTADDGLSIQVDDDGRGGGTAGSDGNGLAGMRERASALGGTLTAGPRAEGGFRVEARLPAPVTAQASSP